MWRLSQGEMFSIPRAEQAFLTANTTIILRKKSTFYKYGMPLYFNIVLTLRVVPGVSKLTPNYYTRHHPSESKRDVLLPIIAPVETFPPGSKFKKEGKDELIPIHQDMRFYATILSPGKSLSYTFQGDSARLGYIHLAQMSGYNPGKETGGATVDVGGNEIREGDGVFVKGGKSGDTIEFENIGDVDAEFVWFDMGGQYKP